MVQGHYGQIVRCEVIVSEVSKVSEYMYIQVLAKIHTMQVKIIKIFKNDLCIKKKHVENKQKIMPINETLSITRTILFYLVHQGNSLVDQYRVRLQLPKMLQGTKPQDVPLCPSRTSSIVESQSDLAS